MTQYYFVAAALPPLSLETKPEFSFFDLRALFRLNLTSADLEKVETLLLLIDLSNLRALWEELPLDPRGTLSPKELEEAVLVKEGLAPFILDFLDRYESVEQRLRYLPSLYGSLYGEMEEKEKTLFLRKYYQFERELRLVLTGFRAKKQERDLVKELQFEEMTEPLVASILAQKDALEYTPPAEYEELKGFFISDPKEQQKMLLSYRLKKIEEMQENEPFSMDVLLGYTARFLLIESWHLLNEEQGLSHIKELSKHG